jgi:hypothetical protein
MSLQTASIAQHAKALRLAAVGAQFASLAEEAAQRNHSHLHYLEVLLQAEMEDRERRAIELRMKEAHLPRIKTLEEFDFTQSPHIPAARIRALAEGGYLERAEPVLLVGDPSGATPSAAIRSSRSGSATANSPSSSAPSTPKRPHTSPRSSGASPPSSSSAPPSMPATRPSSPPPPALVQQASNNTNEQFANSPDLVNSSHRFLLRDSVWEASGVRDVTKELREVTF